jgi:2-keto-3-deoxy-6-phosphogluconate aldolase
MANRVAAIKQADAKRLFKAALEAGFEAAKITLHPDGRIEATASFSQTAANAHTGNTWDDILK